jgi:hypothetical protein
VRTHAEAPDRCGQIAMGGSEEKEDDAGMDAGHGAAAILS